MRGVADSCDSQPHSRKSQQGVTVALSLLDEICSLDEVHTLHILSPTSPSCPWQFCIGLSGFVKNQMMGQPSQGHLHFAFGPHTSQTPWPATLLGDTHMYHPEVGNGVNSLGLPLTSGLQDPYTNVSPFCLLGGQF